MVFTLLQGCLKKKKKKGKKEKEENYAKDKVCSQQMLKYLLPGTMQKKFAVPYSEA